MTLRDYNFFDPYLSGSRRPLGDNAGSYLAVFLVALLVLVGWPAYNMYLVLNLRQQVSELEATILGHPNQPMLAEVITLEGQVKNTAARLKTARAVVEDLTARDWLNQNMLNVLTSVIPQDVVLENLALSGAQNVQMTGEATSKPAIAELQLNLRNTGLFHQIHVSTITVRSGTGPDAYLFSLTLQVKEVADSAANK